MQITIVRMTREVFFSISRNTGLRIRTGWLDGFDIEGTGLDTGRRRYGEAVGALYLA